MKTHFKICFILICLTLNNFLSAQKDTMGMNMHIGEKIIGNWCGTLNEKLEIKLIKKGTNNPVEGTGIADEYCVYSIGLIPQLKIGCCEAILINQGDLDGDGLDDLGVFQAPINGCTYSYTVYSLKLNSWHILINTFLVPTACSPLTEMEIWNKVIKEKDGIYIYIHRILMMRILVRPKPK